MIKFFSNLVVVAFFAALLIIALNSWASTPVVYESYPEGYCVKVDDPSGQYNCEKLPPRYVQQWVKE